MSVSHDSFAALFARPTAPYRGKPFWAWNGALSRDELLRQIHVFAEMGMGGFFIHSRTGLKTEYLGDEWFALVNACADEAEKLGLETWLYDEDRWPSGSAGGLATQDPRHRMKVLRLTAATGDVKWPEKENFVGAFSARVDGSSCFDAMPLGYGETPGRPDQTTLIFTTETWPGHSFYNGYTYLDTLSREATENFIKITHERYRDRCEQRMGSSIHGIFTDEPHHGTVLCENNENRTMPDQRWTLPWTERLWDEFRETWGYDLREQLPELFLQPEGRRISRVKWHYMELIQRMFLENWAQPLKAWCETNGLRLTGHLLHEDSLVAQAVPCGSVMRGYEFFHIPGVDVLAVDNRCFWSVKQLASVARQQGQKWLLSELYGCTGWQLDFAGHKRIGLWQALLGINVRCHHLAWYTMEGEAKRDYPASISFQSAWWREYAMVEDFFARLNVVLTRGERVCDVLVVNPIESTWAQIHPGWAQWLSALDPKLQALENTYREVFAWLTGNQIDFDYGDEDHLARLGSVENERGAVLRLGQATYRTVVIAGLATMRQSTLDLLQRFVDAGGIVVFAGEAPSHVDAIDSTGAKDLAAESTQVDLEEDALVAALLGRGSSGVQITPGRGAHRHNLLVHIRKDSERFIIAMGNLSAERSMAGIGVKVEGNWQVEEWLCETGHSMRFTGVESDGELTHWSLNLAQSGLRVFVLAPSRSIQNRPPEADTGSLSEFTIKGPFAYSLDEPNICVLDVAALQIGEGEWEAPREVLALDRDFRCRFGFDQRSGDMLQPWAADRKECKLHAESFALKFQFEIEELPERFELLLERPEQVCLSLNGARLLHTEGSDWHIDPCLRRLPIPLDSLKIGANELVLRLPLVKETNIEAVYLLGGFGVKLRNHKPTLSRLPAKLAPTDICAQGLPFYSGKITYHLGTLFPLPLGQEASLDLGKFGGACARLLGPQDREPQVIAWPPFTANLPRGYANDDWSVEVILTRRNTFGPLHLLPREQPAIGPMSFRTEGEAFSAAYVLEPAGLLQPPSLCGRTVQSTTGLRPTTPNRQA